MSTHLMDTNIISAHFRRPGGLSHRFIQHGEGLCVSTVVLAELFAWAYLSRKPSLLLEAIQELVAEVTVLDFDSRCAQRFGKLRADLAATGITVPVADLMIASVALTHDLTLVTHNVADFSHIPDLRVVDWLTA